LAIRPARQQNQKAQAGLWERDHRRLDVRFGSKAEKLKMSK
jgi:hypothetical protein